MLLRAALAFNIVCGCEVLLALLFNITLIVLAMYKSSGSINILRYFFIFFAANNVAYAVAHGLPCIYISAPNGYLMCFSSTAICPHVVSVVLSMWYVAEFVSSTMLSAVLFTYRYAILHTQRLRFLFETTRGVVLVGSFYVLYVILVAFQIVYSFNATPEDRATAREAFADDFDYLNFDSVFLIAFNMQSAPSWKLASFLLMLILLTMPIAFIIFTGIRIQSAINNKLISTRRKDEMRILRMMIVQVVNPVVTLYIPFLVDVVSALFVIDMGVSYDFFSYLLCFFPMLSPLIIVYYTPDYRRGFFKISGLAYAPAVGHIRTSS